MLIRHRGVKGFTLIELAIGLVLLSILLMLAIPSMTLIVENGRIKSAASSFAMGLQTARAHAISQNGNVTFTPSGSGWSVTDSTGAVIEGKAAAESSGDRVDVDNATVVTFNGLGRPTPPPPSPPDAYFFNFTRPSVAEARSLRIRLSAGGQVRLCDPLATAAGDTRAC